MWVYVYELMWYGMVITEYIHSAVDCRNGMGYNMVLTESTHAGAIGCRHGMFVIQHTFLRPMMLLDNWTPLTILYRYASLPMKWCDIVLTELNCAYVNLYLQEQSYCFFFLCISFVPYGAGTVFCQMCGEVISSARRDHLTIHFEEKTGSILGYIVTENKICD